MTSIEWLERGVEILNVGQMTNRRLCEALPDLVRSPDARPIVEALGRIAAYHEDRAALARAMIEVIEQAAQAAQIPQGQEPPK